MTDTVTGVGETPKPMSADTMVERVARAIAGKSKPLSIEAWRRLAPDSREHYLAMARAALEAIGIERLEAEKRWLPIETAPKCGVEIDIWAEGRRFANFRWSASRHCWMRGASTITFNGGPTHWMPLPKPPKDNAQKGDL